MFDVKILRAKNGSGRFEVLRFPHCPDLWISRTTPDQTKIENCIVQLTWNYQFQKKDCIRDFDIFSLISVIKLVPSQISSFSPFHDEFTK